jgi:hypothetical protein
VIKRNVNGRQTKVKNYAIHPKKKPAPIEVHGGYVLKKKGNGKSRDPKNAV